MQSLPGSLVFFMAHPEQTHEFSPSVLRHPESLVAERICFDRDEHDKCEVGDLIH